jgi:hypothetical protein
MLRALLLMVLWGSGMRRREFVKDAGAVAAAWPGPADAQQKGMRVNGLLTESNLAEFADIIELITNNNQ